MRLRLVQTQKIKPLHAKTLLHGQEEFWEKRFIIPEFKVSVGFLQDSNAKTVGLKIGWNPEKTTITSAVIRFRLHGNVPFTLPAGSLKAELFFNGVLVGSGGWSIFNSCTTAEGIVNVAPYLRNFDVTAEYDKVRLLVANMFKLAPVTMTVTISGEVTVTGTGKEAQTKTEEKAKQEQLWNYVKWGAIGFGAIAFVGLVVVPLIKKRS